MTFPSSRKHCSTTLLWLAVLQSCTWMTSGFLPLTPCSNIGHASSSATLVLNYHNDGPKDSERAHFEHEMEGAMNNDWRVFRAKLVAQEKQDMFHIPQNHVHRHSTTQLHHHPIHSTHYSTPHSVPAAHRTKSSLKPVRTAANPNSVGRPPNHIQRRWDSKTRLDPYTVAFNNGDTTSFQAPSASYTTQQPSKAASAPAIQPITTSPFPASHPMTPPKPFRIARGSDHHGPHHHSFGKADVVRSRGSISHKVSPEDPFVSEDELPAWLPKTSINKHRWAHESPLIEPGSVLIANERLGGVFHQTVTLIVENTVNGTFGVMINRPLPGNLMQVGSTQENNKEGEDDVASVNIDRSLKSAFRDSKMCYGGPVWPNEFSVLHSYGEVDGARKLCPGVYIGGAKELETQVRRKKMDPSSALFVKGHCAWEFGQLEKEVNQGVFYMASVSADFILRYAGVTLTPEDNPNDLWADILTCMGGRYSDIAARYGGPGDHRPFLE